MEEEDDSKYYAKEGKDTTTRRSAVLCWLSVGESVFKLMKPSEGGTIEDYFKQEREELPIKKNPRDYFNFSTLPMAHANTRILCYDLLDFNYEDYLIFLSKQVHQRLEIRLIKEEWERIHGPLPKPRIQR